MMAMAMKMMLNITIPVITVLVDMGDTGEMTMTTMMVMIIMIPSIKGCKEDAPDPDPARRRHCTHLPDEIRAQWFAEAAKLNWPVRPLPFLPS